MKKLTTLASVVPEIIMVGAHQNINGSRHLITPLSGMVCHPWASTCYRPTINLSAKFDASVSTHYEDIKGDTKYRKRAVVLVVGGQPRSLKIAPFIRSYIGVPINVL